MSFKTGSNYEDGQFDYNALYWLLKNRKRNDCIVNSCLQCKNCLSIPIENNWHLVIYEMILFLVERKEIIVCYFKGKISTYWK